MQKQEPISYGNSVYGDFRTLYEFLYEDQGLTVIPLITGMKGFHLHTLLKGKRYKDPCRARDLLTNFNYWAIQETGVTSLDSHVIGDINRLCRIPNTLRVPENNSYCTFLPQNLLELTNKEIAEHANSIHYYDYEIRRLPVLEDFPYILDDLPNDFSRYLRSDTEDESHVIPTDVRNYLQPITRPCLFRHITNCPEPGHHVRVAFALDLLWNSHSLSQVKKIIQRLNWVDYKKNITNEQLDSIVRTKLKPYTCVSLRKHKIPRACCMG